MTDELNPENYCKHINRHFYDYKGEHIPLFCLREPGHTGPHQALYIKIHEGKVDKATAEWSDAAGTPNAKEVSSSQSDNA